MTGEIGVELDEYDVVEFLKRRGMGVLGLARDGDAYTFPIAFAYDEDTERCIFRFVMTEDSTKRSFLERTESVSLTVYEWNGPQDWKSVVINGTIRPVGSADLGRAAAVFAAVGEEAALDIFNRSLSAYETVWYELEPDGITGRGAFPSSQ